MSAHPQPAPQLKLLALQPRLTSLALWHLLSLDAPTVATLWTIFIARTAHIALPWQSPAAMFLAVWMIYAADRLLDARQLNSSGPRVPGLEARHRFHHQHRHAFLTVIPFAALALALLLRHIDLAALQLYVILATLLSAWLLLIHARQSDLRLPKELAVGIVFSAAVFIPTVARAPQLRPALLPAAALFGLVCTLNCLCIYAWEHPASRITAHWTTRWATQHLSQIAAFVLLSSALTAAVVPTAFLPALACALSTTTLLALDSFRRRLSTLHLRAAADLALLTPLLFLWSVLLGTR